jgi:phosphate transport system substrate-binding protein
MKISKMLMGAAAATLLWSSAQAAEINGAGATAPYPVYAKWAEAYKAKTGTAMNYQSIGSGGGIKQIQSKTVDFGASDAPLSGADLQKWGLEQFPAVIAGAVPVVNIKGVDAGKLKLDGPTLADIYMGKIKKWNEKAITDLNPGLTLPATAIAPVYRSDGSGTTFNFTTYLSDVSPEFKSKIGANTSVEFPAGIGGKGNEGVSAVVGQTDGAIGYVEYAYAMQNKLVSAEMKNKDGKFVSPSVKSFQAAAASADWSKAPGMGLILVNQAGAETWPITFATFILLYQKQEKPENGKAVLSFFDWSFKNGSKLAEDLAYVPLPEKVVGMIEDSWKKNVKAADGKPVFGM